MCWTLLGLWFRVEDLGFRVQGSGFRVQGAGFRVEVYTREQTGLLELSALNVNPKPRAESGSRLRVEINGRENGTGGHPTDLVHYAYTLPSASTYFQGCLVPESKTPLVDYHGRTLEFKKLHIGGDKKANIFLFLSKSDKSSCIL